jgi:hypothetical protein
MRQVSARTKLRRALARLLPATALLVCVAALAGCGASEDKGDVEGLLDRAFRQSIPSADVKIDSTVTLDGLKGFERPIRLQAAGPYIAGGGQGLPKFDIDVTLGAQGAGQTVQFGVLRTPDRAFVKFGGVFYEQPRAGVARTSREFSAGRGRRSGSLRELGLLPRTWVVGAREVGEQKVDGVDTRHVTGALDIRSLLRDLAELAERSGRAVGGGAGAPGPLSSKQLDDLAGAVQKPSFDAYVGKDDDIIRRFSVQLQARVPEEDRAEAGGIEGGSVRFSIEFAHVDGDQVVEAPAKARPLSDLAKALGGLSALGGLGALGSDGDQGGADSPSSGAGGGSRGEAASPEASGGQDGVEAFQLYSNCLDKAGPDDTKALSRCAKLLR